MNDLPAAIDLPAAGLAGTPLPPAVQRRLPASFVQRSPAMKLVYGDGAADRLVAELALLGVRRPMLLAGRSAQRSALFGRVAAQLAATPAVLADEVPAHSSVELVERLAGVAREAGVDGFVAVGGGSASDTAKAVALLLAEGGRLADHASRFTPPATLHVPALRQPKLPIVSIPCTASGAEVTPSLGVRDDGGAKLLFTDPQLASRLVLIDPQANVEVPAVLMLATGMNGVAHCIEGLYSKERSPLAETLALDALSRFAAALPAVRSDPADAAARGALLYAAHLSGLVLLHARTCLHHAVCHAIGSVAGVGHGDANSALLPHALAFNAPAAGDALQRAAQALGDADGDAAAAVRRLQAAIGVPTRLRDIGVEAPQLDRIAAKTMGERGLHFNPRTVADAAEVRALLEAAY